MKFICKLIRKSSLPPFYPFPAQKRADGAVFGLARYAEEEREREREHQS